MTTIAIPTHDIFDPLLGNLTALSDNKDVRVVRVDDNKCSELLHTNSVDVALVSPLGYAKGVERSDYRIILPQVCILEGWTNQGAILFGNTKGTLRSIATLAPNDFITPLASILLKEQYDIDSDIQPFSGTLEQALAEYDAVVCWRGNISSSLGLDISEEWNLSFDYPLPFAMWVTREEHIEDNILSTVRSIMNTDIVTTIDINEKSPAPNTLPRAGSIHYSWGPSTEEALTHMMTMLYYHLFVSEIPAVKIAERD